ncbi:hypothetical protein ACXZ1K_17335 [Pedobacter sp. PWIIR3]
MKSKRSLLTILFISVLGFLAFVPKDNGPLDKLVTSLQKWTETNPIEKVYLHTDKPYYAVGDTIWFKAYVTTGSRHQLSAMSGALYVELINEKDSIIKSLKLPLAAGMSMGDITLEDQIVEGSYRLRAYTQWMRNAGAEYFYDHTFTVGTPVSQEVTAISNYQYKIIDNKTTLTATLNYTDDEGKPITGQNVEYEIMLGRTRIYTKSIKTDDQGSISIGIPNEKQLDLRGGYIRTTFNVKGNKIIKDFPIKAGLSQTDIQFFPESGNLVNGVASKVGFKITGIDGKGLSVKGKILDSENNEITEIATLNAGMGSFSMMPQAGKTYIAQISLPDGTNKTIPLPVALNDGYVLSVFQPNADSVLVRVSVSPSKAESLKSTPVNLGFIAQIGGETIMASPITITRATTSFWLEKSAFPSGIAQFTLFSDSGEPLNERIAFIKSKDQMQLRLSTARKVYKSKERVELNLEARDRSDKLTAGNFSVTVIDESKVPVDESEESTIFSNLLLTSDLKGYVEKPNYYFTKDNAEVNKALDNLMLTQGYRRFTWKEVAAASSTNQDPKSAYMTNSMFKVEGLGVDISGVVKTLGGKMVPNAKVMLMATKAGILQNTTADAGGRFKFEGLVLTDSIKFAVQARTEKNGTKVEVILDSVPKVFASKNKNIAEVNTNIFQTLKTYIDYGKKQDSIAAKMGKLSMVQRLREVNISAKRNAAALEAPQGMFKIPSVSADQTFVFEDAEKCATLLTCLQGRLHGVVFENVMGVTVIKDVRGSVMNLILDGRKVDDPYELTNLLDLTLSPEDILRIEVVRTNGAMISYLSGPAILIIRKNGVLLRKPFNPNVANIQPKGFNKAKEFYSPRYDRPGSDIELPDLRSTIFWDASVKTYSTGKSTINFFNGDGPGNYKVIVEGINAEGELGRQVYRYAVEGDRYASNGIIGISKLGPPEGLAKTISAGLDSLKNRLPIEKVYLHTDKPYYNIGDTLWFKSYVMDANLSASKQSKLLYIELDDDSSEVVRRISIPVNKGLGWGQIPLPAKIFHEGGYTLRAYTNWMQNFGEDYVFTKRFYLGIPKLSNWLVNSKAEINNFEEKDRLDVNINLQQTDKSPVGLKDVEVKIYEGDHWIFNEKMRTTQEGNLEFSKILKEKTDGRNLRVEIRTDKKDRETQILQVPLTINRKGKIDLQFLPEGGHLVAGLRSVVGFKAIAENGKGTPVNGSILDSKGVEVAKFEAIHNGMGSFEFTPKPAEVYTARLNLPGIDNNSYVFPRVETSGTIIHVDNLEDNASLKITLKATSGALKADSSYYLVGTSKGVMNFWQKVDSNTEEISIAKSKFPTGVSRFTLFQEKRPINERAVFIDHDDRLIVQVDPSKPAYLKRDSAELVIHVKDKNGLPVKGNFSITVTDDSQVKADSTGNEAIGASLLLSSNLKGAVESPGYYLNRSDKNSWLALDNLMLTQGWTGYAWEDVFSEAKLRYQAEKEFQISGVVTSLFKKPVANMPVLISSKKPSFITTSVTDLNGRYVFKNLPPIDSGSFFIQAMTAKGKQRAFGGITVERFRAPEVPSMIRSAVLPWYVNTDSTQVNYVKRAAEKADDYFMKGDGIRLNEVNIARKKVIPGSRRPFTGKEPDLVFDKQDIRESGTMNLYQLLKQKIPGFKIFRNWEIPGGPVMFAFGKYRGKKGDISIDGKPLDFEIMIDDTTSVNQVVDALSYYQVETFSGLEVNYKSLAQIRAYYFAVIDITTPSRTGYHVNNNPGAVTYRPLPIMYPQEFYSPKYAVKTFDAGAPDFRSTLFWEPNIVTDVSGRAKVSFYTSDITGSYSVNVEGGNMNGSIGSGAKKLKIN